MHAVTSEASPLWLEGHERSLLGYLMTEPSGCDEFLHRVSPGFFFIPAHRKILDAIHDVYDHREKVNHITVSDRLREKGELDSCGGVARVIEISDVTTSAEIVDYALERIVDAYREREAMQICKRGAAGEITAVEAREKLDKILSQIPVRGAGTNWLATPGQMCDVRHHDYGSHLIPNKTAQRLKGWKTIYFD